MNMRYAKNLPCPFCGGDSSKRGHQNDKQRYQCTECNKYFQDEYSIEEQHSGYEEIGNRAYAVGTPQDTIPTLDSLLHSFGVDMDIWKVERWSINQWDVSASRKNPKNGEVTWSTKTNYQAKCNLIRLIPLKHEWMPVKGAVVTPFEGTTVTPLSLKPKKPPQRLSQAVVLSDIHCGYHHDLQTNEWTPLHNEKACEIALNIIKDLQPEEVICVGDALDLADWSTHFLHSPEFSFTTQKSLDWLGSYLRECRQHTNKMVYLSGNHEARMQTAIIKNSVAAYGIRQANMPDTKPVISIPFLLGLDEMDIEWFEYPEGEYWLNDNLTIIHGAKFGTKSGQSVMKMLDSPHCSVICGHVHRLEQAHATIWVRGEPITYQACSIGTLGHIDGRIPHAGSGRMNWQNGFAVVDFDKKDFDTTLIRISNDQAIYRGKVYK